MQHKQSVVFLCGVGLTSILEVLSLLFNKSLDARLCCRFVNKGMAPAGYIFVSFWHLEVGTGKMYQYMNVCISMC